MNNSPVAIEFTNVIFAYKSQTVFQDFSTQIASNQIVSIIGLNGSGKSTLMKLAMGLLHPKSGAVKVLGKPAGDFSLKLKLGSALQDIDFPSQIKVREVLSFVASQYPNSESPDKLIQDFGIADFCEKACGQLSGGMKRRLALACSFIGQPKVIFLDEPTTGLDVNSRKQLMNNLRSYQAKNQALILMINHHPHEVIDFVDQFFHVKNGELQRLTPEQMQEITRYRKLSFSCDTKVDSIPSTIHQSVTDELHQFIVTDSDKAVNHLVNQQVSFQNLEVKRIGAEELMAEVL